MSLKLYYYASLGVTAAIGAFLAPFFGGMDAPLRLLAILMAVDYITGVACALFWRKSPKTKNGAYHSTVCIKGLFRKMGIFAAVLIAVQLDHVMMTNFIRNMTIFFFAANEGLSIIETFGIMGLPMPKVLKEAFELLGQSGNDSLKK